MTVRQAKLEVLTNVKYKLCYSQIGIVNPSLDVSVIPGHANK